MQSNNAQRDMLLNRRNTMKRASEFSLVRQRGVSKPGRFLVLSLAPLPTAPPTKQGEGAVEQLATAINSRVGLITTKRVGCAVQRNKLRRQLREIIRQHGDSIAQGYYIVVIMRHKASLASYAELEQDYKQCQTRLLRSLAKSAKSSKQHSSPPKHKST